MSQRTRKVDTVWEQLFKDYNIINRINDEGIVEISANQIRKYAEPRLVVKFDHKSQLPIIFLQNNIRILPNTRGTYVLGRFKVYENVSYDDDIIPKKMAIPHNIHTITSSEITSESGALHAAYVAGMIDDFTGEKTIPTVSGRMSSNEFDFNITDVNGNYIKFILKNSQVEIDAGYESENFFMICEAKNHRISDFHVRQMYYPYRLFVEKNIGKKIRNIFFTYSNDIFSFFEYDFEDFTQYNSLKLVKQQHYMLDTSEISKDDIYELLQNTRKVYPSLNIPFPQADSFERVIDMCQLLLEDSLSLEDLSTNYDFTNRQADYYQNAARYLGLVEKEVIKKKQFLRLSDEGMRIFKRSTRNKFLNIAEKILENDVFNETLKFHFRKSPDNFHHLSLSRSEIVEVMKRSGLTHTDVTLGRRASTVRAWLEWILKLEDLLDKK